MSHRPQKPRKPRSKKTTPITATLPQEGFLRKPVVLAIFGTISPTLWRWIKAGRFPAGYRLSPGSVGCRIDAGSKSRQDARIKGASDHIWRRNPV